MIGIPWNNDFSFLPPNKAQNIKHAAEAVGKRGFTHVWDILGPFRGV
jgi:hypothetical protein